MLGNESVFERVNINIGNGRVGQSFAKFHDGLFEATVEILSQVIERSGAPILVVV